jgi:hypothetical protein
MTKKYGVRNLSFYDHYVPILIDGKPDEVSVRARATTDLGEGRRLDKGRVNALGLTEVISEFEIEVVDIPADAQAVSAPTSQEPAPVPVVAAPAQPVSPDQSQQPTTTKE